MKVKFEVPVVQYDLLTVEADVDIDVLSLAQKRVLELMQKKNHEFTSFELYVIHQMITSSVQSFSDAVEETIEDKGSEWSFSDNPFDYERTAESFEVIQ